MFVKLLLPALSVVAASASASALQTDARTPPARPAATTAGTATVTSAAAKPNQICIKFAPTIGSRIAKTECKTRQEWLREDVNVDEVTE